LCLHVEKNLALKELQQQLVELTANHEAAIEAMKTAHCEDVESLRKALSSQTALDASEMLPPAATNEPVNSIPSDSVSGDAVDTVSAACDSSSRVRAVRDLAALYHNECEHTACLQSRLTTAREFITYIDNLDQLPSDGLHKDKSDTTMENSHADILAAVRAFALDFRQAASELPLQVENLQRVEKLTTHRTLLSVLQASEEGYDLPRSTELLPENQQPTSSCSEISFVATAVAHDDELRNVTAPGISVNEEPAKDDCQSPVHLGTCNGDMDLVNEDAYDGRVRKENNRGEQQGSAEEGTATEQMPLKEDCDSKPKILENAAELARVRGEYEARIVQLSLKIEELQDKLELDRKLWDAKMTEVTDSHTAELRTKDSELETLTRTIDSLKEKLSSQDGELQNKLESDRKMWDGEMTKLTDLHTAELEIKDSEIETLMRTVGSLKEMLSSQHDELQNKLQSERELWAAEDAKVTDLRAAELKTKDSEIETLTQNIDSLKDMLSSQHDELSSVVRSKEEIICSAEEKHRLEVAAVTESFEKKISELEREHYRIVEEYRQRISEMERSDVELNTQLIAVTEKFNSVTEYTASAERAIEDYRSKAEKWAAEREEMVKAAEMVHAELSEKEAEIVALKEQLQMLRPPSPSSVHDTPVLNLNNVDMEMADVINRDRHEPVPVRNFSHSTSQRLDNEVCSSDNSRHENELVKLQRENFDLIQQLNQQQSESMASLKEQHERFVEQMRSEHRAAMRDVEEQHNAKVINLVKDFNAQMATNENELQKSMKSDLG